jgi:hypothetical protein
MPTQVWQTGFLQVAPQLSVFFLRVRLVFRKRCEHLWLAFLYVSLEIIEIGHRFLLIQPDFVFFFLHFFSNALLKLLLDLELLHVQLVLMLQCLHLLDVGFSWDQSFGFHRLHLWYQFLAVYSDLTLLVLALKLFQCSLELLCFRSIWVQ